MKKNSYIEINTFLPDCFKLDVDYIRVGFTKKQYIEQNDLSTIDIFQYLDIEDLTLIKNKEKYFVFDYCQEGIFQKSHKLFECIHYNCNLYKIDKKQVLYFTSNFKEQAEFDIYPNIYHPWIDWMQNNYIDKECDDAFQFTVDMAIKNFKPDIYFSSFNKTWDRPWRDYFHYLLYKNKLIHSGFVSNHNRLDRLFGGLDVSGKHAERFKKILPLKFDYDYFYGAGKGFHSDIFAFTSPQFHIVTESISDLKTSCFISEKSFKPIAFFQPFFVIGPEYFHRDVLSKIKIKKYYQLDKFNLDDRSEIYLQTRNTVPKLRRMIDHLSNIDRIEWRFKDETTLKHNWKVLRNFADNEKMFKEVNTSLCKRL